MFLMAAMGPPGGGRNVISRRLQSRFNLINMTFPQESQIKRIFGTMIAQKLQDFDEEVKPLGDMMTKVGVVGGRGHCSVCATSPVWWEGGATARCVPPPPCGGVSAAVPFAAQATVEVYNTISTSMLPTPTKIHYLFNLRDISKVRVVCARGKAGCV